MENHSDIEILGNQKVKPILTFIVGVHWDEKAPIKALEILKKRLEKISLKKSIRIIYANKEAIKKNVRFIERDLNNAFFDRWSWSYEENLAKKLKKEIIKTKYNFDFHTTNFNVSKPYWLIASYNEVTQDILSHIWIKDSVFTDKECLIKYATNGIGLEIGNDNDAETITKALGIMERILEHFWIVEGRGVGTTTETNLFLIYKIITKKDFIEINKNITDFSYIRKWDIIGTLKDWKKSIAKENFYAIRVEDKEFIRMAKKIKIED